MGATCAPHAWTVDTNNVKLLDSGDKSSYLCTAVEVCRMMRSSTKELQPEELSFGGHRVGEVLRAAVEVGQSARVCLRPGRFDLLLRESSKNLVIKSQAIFYRCFSLHENY